MGRDFEITSYFPHVTLTPRLLRRLFRDLFGAGLRLDAGAGPEHPVFAGMRPTSEGVSVGAADVEDLLRSRTGALPPGYGVIPLIGRAPDLRVKATGSLQFSVPSARQPELDGVHLRFDDAALRAGPTEEGDALGPGWRALLTWYGVLCEHLHVAYGYGDWEDLFLQRNIPPSRGDVLASRVDQLYRLNCFGPALAQRLGGPHLLATPADAVVRLRYGGVLVGARLNYAGTGPDLLPAAAAHLGLRVR